ncbi:MAG: DNA polymerase III subunit delta [Clostridia bacterium]|nr:DNA polymerase III subunit delta [Clostridia bacterium]
MSAITEQELKKQIRSNEFDNLYFIYGNESYLKKHYLEALIKKIVDDSFKDFNLHTFDGKGIDMKEVALAVEALPMMSERSCVVIKDIKPTELGDGGKDALISVVSDIPETCIVIICALTVEAEGKGWKELISAFDKYGSTVKLEKMSRQELSKYVIKGAKSRGFEIDMGLADYFISIVGDSMTNVLNELEKVCANATDGKIKKENIDAVTVKTAEVKIFELSKNLVSGNSDKAFAILDSLMKQREEPISVLATIITSYVDMYRAKVASSGGHRPEEAAKVFNYGKNDFRLKNGAKNASKMSMDSLRRSLDVLADADEKLKSTTVDGRFILEETMMKLFLLANGEKVC